MRKLLLVFSLAIFTQTLLCAQTKDEASVKKILDEQLAAWNRGDVDAFMQGYWQSDSLKFIGKSDVTYGWQATLENYKKRYPDTAAMGRLFFTLIEIKKLSPEYIFVVGKWDLKRTIGDVGGHFTLLFKKINKQWLIIDDHSS